LISNANKLLANPQGLIREAASGGVLKEDLRFFQITGDMEICREHRIT
jgi:hypothetical protein